MVSFKNRVLIIILSSLLFVTCFFASFSGYGLTSVNADSSDIPSYTFNGSNVGYVGAGFSIGDNILTKSSIFASDFAGRVSSTSAYSGSNFRASFRSYDWFTGTYAGNNDTAMTLFFEFSYQFLSYYNYFKSVKSIEVYKNVNEDGYFYTSYSAYDEPSTDIIYYLYNTPADYSYTKVFDFSRSSTGFDWSSPVTQFKSNDFLFYNFDLLQFTDINGSITGTNYYYGVYTAFQLGDITGIATNVELFDYIRKVQVTSIELGSGYDWSYGTTFDYSMPTDTGLSQRFSFTFGRDMVSYPNNKNFNYVVYNFSNGCRLFIHLPIAYTGTVDVPSKNVLCWNKRIYYLDNVVVGSNDYNAGYNAGFNVGSSAGYTQGFDAGRASGYTQGYADGLSANNDFTFLGLLGAVVDAPLKVFTNLFNFDILGFNLLDFFTGMFTLAIIIWLVRLLL